MKKICDDCKLFLNYGTADGFRMCSVGENDPDGNPLRSCTNECICEEEFEYCND